MKLTGSPIHAPNLSLSLSLDLFPKLFQSCFFWRKWWKKYGNGGRKGGGGKTKTRKEGVEGGDFKKELEKSTHRAGGQRRDEVNNLMERALLGGSLSFSLSLNPCNTTQASLTVYDHSASKQDLRLVG